MDVVVLLAIGGVIILGLATYAGYLLLQLKKQKALQEQHQQLAIEKRNANIFENVDLLCMAAIQGQCDLSEISIRVYCILDYIQGEQRIDVDTDFPALSELYHTVKDMARGDDRQQLPKQDRMRQNLERQKAEAKVADAMIEELKTLQQRVKPLNSQISIAQVS
ncbi:DUF2489 domain-containing protein [Vibrio sp. SCSIO 43136]|uniref:DUF2489 domain-containing protein n=1 Tax=Vibrio sp. SCSIO 43136 TaxID=2819101 RepID=UPI002075CF2B|nr:DUF2489 domain-containing protein [Vibrio sp. SCSIO 43136]USD65207.1 DUF2489 domain-containing protein [Vibrio sp. SCSIO 43136]